jgi:L-lactate dehydrogenase complex protein LldF
VCPVAIDIPSMLVRLRKESVNARGRSAEAMTMGAAAWAMGSSRRWALVLRLARAGRLLGRRRGVIRRLPPPLSSWTARRDLPRPPRQTLREWWAQEHTGE